MFGEEKWGFSSAALVAGEGHNGRSPISLEEWKFPISRVNNGFILNRQLLEAIRGHVLDIDWTLDHLSLFHPRPIRHPPPPAGSSFDIQEGREEERSVAGRFLNAGAAERSGCTGTS